jgi:hypothetical protein
MISIEDMLTIKLYKSNLEKENLQLEIVKLKSEIEKLKIENQGYYINMIKTVYSDFMKSIYNKYELPQSAIILDDGQVELELEKNE